MTTILADRPHPDHTRAPLALVGAGDEGGRIDAERLRRPVTAILAKRSNALKFSRTLQVEPTRQTTCGAT
ncbi:MAG TPA: hypothetical protein VIR00_01155 [Micromonosporaceae bacterium]